MKTVNRSLPEKFDVTVDDFSIATSDRDTIEKAKKSWTETKAELIRRNYTVSEQWDKQRMRFVATCVKRTKQ